MCSYNYSIIDRSVLPGSMICLVCLLVKYTFTYFLVKWTPPNKSLLRQGSNDMIQPPTDFSARSTPYYSSRRRLFTSDLLSCLWWWWSAPDSDWYRRVFVKGLVLLDDVFCNSSIDLIVNGATKQMWSGYLPLAGYLRRRRIRREHRNSVCRGTSWVMIVLLLRERLH